MSNAGDASKRARREHAREEARRMREQEQKRRRRNRLFIQGGVGVVVLAIAAVVVLVIVSSNQPAGPGAKNMASGGIVLASTDGAATPVTTSAVKAGGTPKATTYDYSDGKAHIVEYLDWSCPVCKSFEASYGTQITQLVDSDAATLEIHPVAILDNNYPGSRYSSRAANAASCVASYDPKNFLTVQTSFYDNQPEEGTQGLSNSAIMGLITGAGVTSDKVKDCVNNEEYKSWVQTVTTSFTDDADLINPSSGGHGTPTVVVNGILWDSSTTADFPTFLEQAVAATSGTSTETPAPTDTTTPAPTDSATPTPAATN